MKRTCIQNNVRGVMSAFTILAAVLFFNSKMCAQSSDFHWTKGADSMAQEKGDLLNKDDLKKKLHDDMLPKMLRDSSKDFKLMSTSSANNVELIGRWANGPCNAVAVNGNIAYFGNGGFLEIVDFSDPANPLEIGKALVPAIIQGVAVSGDYAYVADERAGLRIINISDPVNPYEAGYFETGYDARSLAVIGGYAYVADGDDLRVIDVSDPTNPFEVGYYDTGYPARSIAISGDYAYVANDDYGLVVINISDPSNPFEVSHVYTADYARGVTVSGNYAYVAAGGVGARVIDISDPTNPFEVGYFDTGGIVQGISASGDYIYVADHYEGFWVVDVSDPTNPFEVGHIETHGTPISVVVSGNYAYVADEHGGLRVIDVSDPTNPFEVGYFETNDYAYNVAVSGNYAYVAYQSLGLIIIDISDPVNPFEAGYFDTGGSAKGVAVNGNYAYVADAGRGLRVIDISNPTNPFEVGYYFTGSWAHGVAVNDNDIYVADYEDGLYILRYFGDSFDYKAHRIPNYFSVPTIDGVFNEPFWSLAPEDSLLFGGIPETWGVVWTNWNDNLVTWKAVWSDISNELYVAINIKDDIRGIFDNNDPFVPWKDECLEIFTDGDNSGGFYENSYDNAQQWLVTEENKRMLDDYPDSLGYHLYTGDDLVTAVTWGTNGDWNCEAKIKIYDTLPTSRKILSMGDIIGWNIWYDDSDNETWEIDSYTRDHQVGWLYEGKANNNADYFGDLLLAGDLPHIRVISPNGGEIWYVDTTYPITWTSAGTSGGVKLAYSTDEGFNWTTIVTNTVDDGFYSWKIPDDPSDKCLVLVTDTDGNPMDQSDSCFAIASAGFNINGHIDYYFNNEPVKDALVKTNTVYSDTTDLNGEYDLLSLPSNNYTVRPEKTNDIGNAISAFDAAWILQYGVGLRTFTPYQMLTSDVTGNGNVSAYDASMILQYGVGLINKFPVMDDTTHFWRFVPEDFPITQTNWNIAPDSIAYTPLNSDTTGNYYGIIYGDVSGNWYPSGSVLASLSKSSGETVDIRLEDVYGTAGEKISLPLVVNSGSGIIAMSFTLAYNPQVLKGVGASLTALTKDYLIAHQINKGEIKVALAGGRAIEGSGSVVKLEFEVLETALDNAVSYLNVLDMQLNEGNIMANIQAAEFKIGSLLPEEYALQQNYPNPFNPETVIKYQLLQPGHVVLRIYNSLGREVRTLINQEKEAGYHEIHWDGRDHQGLLVASGIYFYRIQAGDFRSIKKMLYLR